MTSSPKSKSINNSPATSPMIMATPAPYSTMAPLFLSPDTELAAAVEQITLAEE